MADVTITATGVLRGTPYRDAELIAAETITAGDVL